MKLKQLLKGTSLQTRGSKEVEITGLTADSRTVAPGNLFIARKGEKSDGAEFIAEALRAGAAAVLADIYDPFIEAVQIIHPNPKQMEGKLAARFYGDASEELMVIGLTGTKGKTTTSYLVKHLLDGLGKKCGLVGTIETIVGEHRYCSQLTTHDAITNHRLLKEMVAQGCKAAVLEVSSHGLDQGRVDDIQFKAAIFTNLFPDHLDYHSTMEEYVAAKKKLFDSVLELAIVNADSPWMEAMVKDAKAPLLTFGEKGDLRPSELVLTERGTEFTVSYRGKKERIQTKLMGRFNVYNVLGAMGAALYAGGSLEEIATILATFQSVPGRLEQAGVGVFVDYAHNGEALKNVLITLREIAKGRLIVLFGCGGERDPRRRSEMAEAAEQFADLAIVTSDNPRGEDPDAIGRQILAAFKAPEKVVVELDRGKAIEWAIGHAEEKDIVLIAGKGHERVQIFANKTVPFDDLLIAKKALQNLKKPVL